MSHFRTVLLFIIYFLTARFGLTIDPVSGFATLVWLPTGISLAALLLFGPQLWPGIALGAFLANLTLGAPLPAAIGIATGNTLEALLGFYLLRRFKFQTSLERLRDVLGFIFFASFLSTMVSATIGTMSLWLSNVTSSDLFGKTWRAWWVGDMLGALTITPLILTWATSTVSLIRNFWRDFFESLALVVILILASLCIFGFLDSDYLDRIPIIYLFFPLLIWAALRFGQRGAVSSLFIISFFSIGATIQGIGPFAQAPLHEGLFFLQSFLGIVAVTAMILAAAVTERTRSQKELKQTNQELRRLSEIRSEFVSIVSHELKTPLSAIKEGIQLVVDGVDGPIEKAQKMTLGIALSNVDRLARLIDNVLDYSKLESGVMEMDFKKTDLSQLIEEIYLLMNLAASSKKLVLQKELPSNPIVTVCDTDKIRQVIINFIDNALKFTDPPGRIVVRLIPLAEQIRIEVEDNGIGIKKEDQQKIFDMFSQSSSNAWRDEGYGVGLAVCKLIAQLHQGTISVESAPNQGSKFVLIFPNSLSSGKRILSPVS